ncbi:hypothetical protein BOX15_Mlig029025g2 [Macrostomum lignano]|uniref:GPI inositol-deacylase n=1 Tax=Macrostomum lignano TaxID=282301 RepID=A0A267DFA9_9PLAT|nr:hypothetical protein BOX15_Mlig029025g2 [Macrostomum lignano]
MKKYLFVFALIITALIFLLASLYSFVFDVEYNKCDMTYMFQYPEYIPVTLPASVRRKFPEYNLFVYTEGHSEPVSRSVFEGSPLLFIPGNDGSHKQVRSLASVAIQMRKTLGTKTRFDCFAVDLNSEFSALHGPFLYRQSEFVRHVVDHIESLYSSRAKFSIVLVGHSMGGLVARHAMTLEDFDRGRVPLIVTLATPHQRPVLASDSEMLSFYSDMNSYWRKNRATGLGHVALISIGGGDRDLEVALPLTRIDSGLTLPRNALWASASHVRNAWASTDHRCIVWCKQLVIALCRSLFSTAAAGRSDAQSVVVEFRRHLLPSTPAGLNSILKSAKPASDESGRWFYRDLADPRHRSIRFERDKLSRPVFLKIVGKPIG